MKLEVHELSGDKQTVAASTDGASQSLTDIQKLWENLPPRAPVARLAPSSAPSGQGKG